MGVSWFTVTLSIQNSFIEEPAAFEERDIQKVDTCVGDLTRELNVMIQGVGQSEEFVPSHSAAGPCRDCVI